MSLSSLLGLKGLSKKDIQMSFSLSADSFRASLSVFLLTQVDLSITQRSEIHDRATRHRNTLEIPFCKTATGQRSFLFRAVKPWNNLPEFLKCIDTLRNFKTSFRNILYNELYKDCQHFLLFFNISLLLLYLIPEKPFWEVSISFLLLFVGAFLAENLSRQNFQETLEPLE